MAVYETPPTAPEARPFYKNPVVIILGVLLLCACVGCGALGALGTFGASQAGTAIEEISTQAAATLEAGGFELSTPEAGSSEPGTTDSEPVEGDTVSAFELQFAQCFNDSSGDGELVETVEVVPCTTPHDNEIFLVTDFPAGASDPFPGEEAIDAFAEEQCLAAFDIFVGLSFDESVYGATYFQPTEETWAERGDREIVCYLFEPGVRLSESAQGSQR